MWKILVGSVVVRLADLEAPNRILVEHRKTIHLLIKLVDFLPSPIFPHAGQWYATI